jgi:TM2 domain-containing membrane protein YozV
MECGSCRGAMTVPAAAPVASHAGAERPPPVSMPALPGQGQHPPAIPGHAPHYSGPSGQYGAYRAGAYPGMMPMVQPRCSRVVYILLGIFLGGFGVHNFVAGYTSTAVAQLLLYVGGLVGIFCTMGLSALCCLAVFIWTIVEICTVTRDANGVPMN